MKSLLMAFTMIASVYATTVSANEGTGTINVEKAFQKTFKDAKNATWTESSELIRVSFEKDQQAFNAFYNLQGDLIAVAKYLSITQLSEALQTDLKNKIKDTNLIELFELTENGKTMYYATLDNGKKQQVLVAAKNKWHKF